MVNRTNKQLCAWLTVIVTLSVASLSCSDDKAKETDVQKFETAVSGDWTNVGEDKTLTLWISEHNNNHEAEMDIGQGKRPPLISKGNWSSTPPYVSVHATGPAGSYDLQLVMVNNGDVLFLAPVPENTARLDDSFYYVQPDHQSDLSDGN